MSLTLNRIGQGHCCPIASSEPDKIVSHHPAQAFQKADLVGAARLLTS